MSEQDQSPSDALQQHAQPKNRWRLRRILTFLIVGGFFLGGLRLVTINVALWRGEVALEERAHQRAIFHLGLVNFLDSIEKF